MTFGYLGKLLDIDQAHGQDHDHQAANQDHGENNGHDH